MTGQEAVKALNRLIEHLNNDPHFNQLSPAEKVFLLAQLQYEYHRRFNVQAAIDKS